MIEDYAKRLNHVKNDWPFFVFENFIIEKNSIDGDNILIEKINYLSENR